MVWRTEVLYPWTDHGLKEKGLKIHSFNYGALCALKSLKQ